VHGKNKTYQYQSNPEQNNQRRPHHGNAKVLVGWDYSKKQMNSDEIILWMG